MSLPIESQGPDPCRSSLLCQKYHERSPCREGTLYNCCCCDPCLYIRPNPNLEIWSEFPDPPIPGAECFRCAPRALFVRFTPTADEYDDCCYPASELVHAEIDITRGFVTAVYSTTIFGIVVTVRVGRFPDPGDDSDFSDYHRGYCAWKITAEQTEYDTQEVEYEIEEVGSSDGINVPDVSLGPFEGPQSCMGDISLAQFMKDKLPYVLRDELSIDKFVDLCPDNCYGTPECLSVQSDGVIHEYERVADVGGYPAYEYTDAYTGDTHYIRWNSTRWVQFDPSFVEIGWGGEDEDCPLGIWSIVDPAWGMEEYDDPFCVSECNNPHFVCGDCTQVCTRVCVSGNWRGVWGENKWEFLEFRWFSEVIAKGGYPAVEQGWAYTDPVTDQIERLLLVDSSTSCTLVTDFHDRDFGTITINSGCNCALFESTQMTVGGTESYWYHVHCGWCSCYHFYCGSCRCVPVQICIQYVLGSTFYGPYILEWDEDNKQWGDDYTDTVTVHLERGNGGECQMVIYYEGEALYLYALDDVDCYEPSLQYTVLDCQQEMLPFSIDGVRQSRRIKCMDPEVDFVGISHEGYESCADDYMYIWGTTFVDDCRWYPCGSYIRDNCPNECIDDPETLHATVTGICTDYDPDSGLPFITKWSLDFDLKLVREYQGNMAVFCNYVGSRVVNCNRCGQTYSEVWKLQAKESGWTLTIYYFECVDGQLVPRTTTTVFPDDVLTMSCNPFYVESDWMYLQDDDLPFIPPVYCAGNIGDCEGDCIGVANPSPCANWVKLVATL